MCVSVQVITGHRNAPPPPTGAGLAQGGRSYYMTQVFTEQGFLKKLLAVEEPLGIPPFTIPATLSYS